MGALIDRLIAASLRHRAIVIGAAALLAAAGLWSFATLNTDAFPDLTPNQVLVMIEVPGLSPAEVEQQVTYPMEVAMLGLPRTTDVRSISKAALSVVTVTFGEGVRTERPTLEIGGASVVRGRPSMATSIGYVTC